MEIIGTIVVFIFAGYLSLSGGITLYWGLAISGDQFSKVLGALMACAGILMFWWLFAYQIHISLG